MKVAGTLMYTSYQDIGAAEGWITKIQWLVSGVRLIRKAWRACRGKRKGINKAHFEPKGPKGKALVELMGPGATIPEVKRVKKKKQLVPNVRGNSDDSDGAKYVQKA